MEEGMYCFSLIKKGSVHTGKGKIIPKKDVEELINASEILDAARTEMEETLQENEETCKKLKEEAKEQGFQEGLHLFNTQILYFEERLKVMKHEMQKSMLPLVLKATKRIVGEELELNPDSVVNIVTQSVKSVTQCTTVKLYVNRADMDLLEAHKEKLKSAFDQLESFQIEERPDVDKGSCIIETERGILNATLENQFRALENAFETYMKKR